MPPGWTKKAQCARCGTQPPKPMFCTACKSTYCGRDCQKAHWPKHKATCQSIVRQMQEAAKVPSDVLGRDGTNLTAEALLMELKKWSTTHASILGWAAEQATQLWLHPSRIRTHAVRFALAYEPDRRKPHQFVLEGIRVARVPQETADLDEGWIARCRSETDELTSIGGLGMLMYALECGDVSLCMMCGIRADELPDASDNLVLCSNYEDVLANVVSGKTSDRPVLDAWGAMIYANVPFPEKRGEMYLQVKLEVERNGGSARVQLRTRKDDKPLPQLPMEFTVPL